MSRILIPISAIALLAACSTAVPAPRLSQERQACAAVGIAPDQAGYASCVANLDTALVQSRLLTSGG